MTIEQLQAERDQAIALLKAIINHTTEQLPYVANHMQLTGWSLEAVDFKVRGNLIVNAGVFLAEVVRQDKERGGYFSDSMENINKIDEELGR